MTIKHPCKTGLFRYITDDQLVKHVVISFLLLSSCQLISSIKDIGSLLKPVWGMPAGKEYTLDEVEGYLRNPTPYSMNTKMCFTVTALFSPLVKTLGPMPALFVHQSLALM